MNPEEFEEYFPDEDMMAANHDRRRWVVLALGVFWLAVIGLVVSCVSGCSMRNEEIIAQVKLCRDNGLEPVEVQNQITMQITDIICTVPR
jgi:hypothetical protein